jgi:hypothetical protein
MSYLRLKTYTSDIYDRYLRLQDEPTEDEKITLLGKRLRLAYTLCCKTVLFFSQPLADMSLSEWCDTTPISFQLEVDNFISLLEDSARWSLSAIGLNEAYSDAMSDRLILDIDSYRITLQPEYENDALTTQFEKICNLVHSEVPNNLRKRKALIRLIWAYLSAKELVSMSHELTSCDRIEYLRRLTKY